MRTYATMRKTTGRFSFTQRHIYADGAIVASKASQRRDLEEFHCRQSRRRRWPSSAATNLIYDANVRAFNAEVPVFSQWDDHGSQWWWRANRYARYQRKNTRPNALLRRRAPARSRF